MPENGNAPMHGGRTPIHAQMNRNLKSRSWRTDATAGSPQKEAGTGCRAARQSHSSFGSASHNWLRWRTSAVSEKPPSRSKSSATPWKVTPAAATAAYARYYA